jgi:AraC-like DNA-binding protein
MKAFQKMQEEQPLLEHPKAAQLLYALYHKQTDKLDEESLESILTEDSSPIGMLIPWKLLLLIHSHRIDEALDWLTNQVRNRQGQYMNACSMPLLAPIRKEEMFLHQVASEFPSLSSHPFSLFSKPTSNEKLSKLPEDECKRIQKALHIAMEMEHLYTNPTLSLRDLAEKVETHANKLSWLLNDRLGKSFNDYVNAYRLEAFKQRAKEDHERNFTLLGLAYEAGFNSKSVFNDYFKRYEGCTPSQWLKQMQ